VRRTTWTSRPSSQAETSASRASQNAGDDRHVLLTDVVDMMHGSFPLHAQIPSVSPTREHESPLSAEWSDALAFLSTCSRLIAHRVGMWGETLRAALDDLVALAPNWLVKQISQDWFKRFSQRVENDRVPNADTQRQARAEQIGADGQHLLSALEHAGAPEEGKDLKRVHVLRRVWRQYSEVAEGKVKWRAGPQAEKGEGVVCSPDDPEAQTGERRSGRAPTCI
jgi:hypothetical protein